MSVIQLVQLIYFVRHCCIFGDIGRPYPLDGELYANAFVHFRPADGWDYTPGDILENYLPAKITFVNQVALQTSQSSVRRMHA